MSEIEKIYNVNLDITKTLEYPVMEFTQKDTLNKIIFTVSNNGQAIANLNVYNYKIMLKRPDGVLIYKIPIVVNNTLEYTLGTYELEVSGFVKGSIEIYEGLNRITTKNFIFSVVKSLNDRNITESDTLLHIQYDYNDLANKPEINLISDIIVGTKQTVTFNPDKSIQKVQHKDSSNNIVREDVFTYAENLITEIRTLTNGSNITFKYHLDTLETEVI